MRKYEHLMGLYYHVYNTLPNSKEREKRLAELSDKQSEELYNFAIKVLNGEIDLSTIGEGEKGSMQYKEWRMRKSRLATADYEPLAVFERMYPDTAKKYTSRYLAEQKKRSEIMAIEDINERQMAIAANIDLF